MKGMMSSKKRSKGKGESLSKGNGKSRRGRNGRQKEGQVCNWEEEEDGEKVGED